MSAGDRAVGDPERLHPLYLLTGLGGSLRAYSAGYAVIAYLAVQGRWGSVLVATCALFVIVALGLFIYWRKFSYRVGDSEIRIDKGLISRVHRSIPFERIQDVDISQGPLARLLGLAKVKFETGGGAGQAGAEEGVLEAITLERAQELRQLVRARQAKTETEHQAEVRVAEVEAEPVYAMSGRRLLLAGTFNFSLALFAGLIGFTQTVGQVAGFDPLSRDFWLRVLSAGGPLRDFILGHKAATAMAGALLLVLVGVMTGITRTVIRDYGFRIDRTGRGLRRRRGLLTRTDVTLPVKRAQAVILSGGPVRECFGFREIRLQSLAQDEDRSGNHVLAPLADEEEANRVLSELGWGALLRQLEWTRVSSAFVSSMIVGLAPVYVLLAGQLLLLLFPLQTMPGKFQPEAMTAVTPLAVTTVITFTIVALSIGLRWLAWRTTAYAVDGDRLLMRAGWWRRRMTILPLRRIQSIDLNESFVTRWFGIASLRFGVAGGTALVVHSIPAIPRGEARKLRDRLLDLPV